MGSFCHMQLIHLVQALRRSWQALSAGLPHPETVMLPLGRLPEAGLSSTPWANQYCRSGINLRLPGKNSFPAVYCRDVAKEGVGGNHRQRFGMEAYFVA